MTNGKKLEKKQNWEHFIKLRKIRDNTTIHAKQSSFEISIYDMAKIINRFQGGIAGLLIQLHDLFDEKIPAIIIRDSFAPEVYVIETGF